MKSANIIFPNQLFEDFQLPTNNVWEDRTPFEAIMSQFNLNESAVTRLMRKELKQSSFKRWRKRVTSRKTKHRKLNFHSIVKFKSKSQRAISNNVISKKRR